MKLVAEPKVYLVAKTDLFAPGLQTYLRDIGEPTWFPDPREEPGETLVEAAGRLCYRSWQPWDPTKPECSNPNVTKVREGNKTYLANLIRSEHGAVLEHTCATFVFRDVSRVFTHELVRHRAGMAYSQESLRYVRLSDLRFWVPPSVGRRPAAVEVFHRVLASLEVAQATLARIFEIDEMVNFTAKKLLTSMFRRVAPIGLATSIMATGNLRAWRHIVSQRTSTHAEEEIRLVMGKAARILKATYPHAFFDMDENEEGEWALQHPKI